MYLKSSEIVKIGEKNYLRIFLEKEYPYLVKFSSKEMDQEFEILEMLFEEPTSLDDKIVPDKIDDDANIVIEHQQSTNIDDLPSS